MAHKVSIATTQLCATVAQKQPQTIRGWIPIKLCDFRWKTKQNNSVPIWPTHCIWPSPILASMPRRGKPGGLLWFFCYPIFESCSHLSFLFPGALFPVLSLSAFLFKMRLAFRSVQPGWRTETGELAFCGEGDGLEDGALEGDTSHGLGLGPVLSSSCQTSSPGSMMWVKPWPGSHRALDGTLSFGQDILLVLR